MVVVDVKRSAVRSAARHCLLPKRLLDDWVLEEGRPLRIRAGLAATEVLVSSQALPPASGEGDAGRGGRRPVVLLGRDCFDDLSLPWDLTLWMRRDAAGGVVLGPVVSVFVNDRYFDALLEQDPPRSAIELMKANRRAHALVYWFSSDQARLLSRRARGAILAPHDDKWRRLLLPMGDVLYDRGVNFAEEEKPAARYLRRQLAASDQVHFINRRDCFDKWWTHQALSSHKEVRPYLPETVRYQSVDDVMSFLGRMKTAYLKSFYGSGGSQVMVVERQAGGCICWHGAGARSEVAEDARHLAAIIDGFFGPRRLVVQQGIDLLQYNGRRIDNRVLLNKNGHGVWEAAYNQARLAQPDQRITNVSLGAEVHEFVPLVAAALGGSVSRARQLDEEMQRVAKMVAHCLESEYGPHGEIGIDLAVDRGLRIWFLEANAKPDKDPEPSEGVKEVYPQFLNILEYARFLAGFHQA